MRRINTQTSSFSTQTLHEKNARIPKKTSKYCKQNVQKMCQNYKKTTKIWRKKCTQDGGKIKREIIIIILLLLYII